MQRVLSTATLLGLLIATAAAFAITERLKLVRSPVYGTYVSKWLSPVCGCARGKAKISVKLRHGDDVTLTILDRHRDVVRTLAAGEYVPRGRAVWVWDGRSDAGARVPDGVYRPQIHLARQRRTILLPNRIALDAHPPVVREVKPSRYTISPDGDNVGDSIKLSYAFDSPAHAVVYLYGKRVIYTRSHQERGSVTWHGTLDGAALPAGMYLLSVGGVDLAGNVTPAYMRWPVFVRVRYIRLGRERIRVARPGARFSVPVDTDAPRYWWKLGGRHGVSSAKTLVLRAPRTAGRYRLVVGERAYTYRATVVVGRG